MQLDVKLVDFIANPPPLPLFYRLVKKGEDGSETKYSSVTLNTTLSTGRLWTSCSSSITNEVGCIKYCITPDRLVNLSMIRNAHRVYCWDK